MHLRLRAGITWYDSRSKLSLGPYKFTGNRQIELKLFCFIRYGLVKDQILGLGLNFLLDLRESVFLGLEFGVKQLVLTFGQLRLLDFELLFQQVGLPAVGKFQPELLGFLVVLSLQPFRRRTEIDNTCTPASFKFQELLIIVVLLLLEL